MAQKNTTAYIILGLLAHEDSSGYDLKKKIDLSISQFWDVGYGQLYPTLKTLEAEGSVTGTKAQSEKGPDRIVYSITETGKQKLINWLAQPNESEYVRYEILLKLFFGGLGNPKDNIKRIEEFQNRHTGDLQLIQTFKTNLSAVLKDNQDHLYYYLTVLFGEHLYKAYLEWAEEALEFIQKNIKPEVNYETSENT
ncbi:PadR family transcriptional regulator [Anaerocolumna xylanovorans]|uniref:DNA-binding transcriptional regulator, PadR family n=1 Tax=Anaerocolumna xylanovorans DSM 12503 TaxID=1121345 RepID=A0A1M7YFS8_9FIRM|nr:PadR family transcriptional regulator [Anaerocolumna xylanovorans]SHO51368.1 DNA-binding transcriptional regulator, PadR family [Anaerocolumna xylanovorans DSM 12503]